MSVDIATKIRFAPMEPWGAAPALSVASAKR
jgi:hypothetical protein